MPGQLPQLSCPSPDHNRRIDLAYRHVKAITLFQELYRLKRQTLHHLNSDLDTIYHTLISVSNNAHAQLANQVISPDNYQKYMQQIDAILIVFKDLPRPLTLATLYRQPTIRYKISYLSYQTVELVHQCGASTLYDVFQACTGQNWDLYTHPPHMKLLRLYNSMFVPINVKYSNTDTTELKVLKYSAFTSVPVLKVHGAELIVPFYNKSLIIRGYFRDDPLNMARIGNTLGQKFKELQSQALARNLEPSVPVAAYLEQISLRDFLCLDTSALLNMMDIDLDELKVLGARTVAQITEEFAKATTKRQINMLTLLLLSPQTELHARGIVSMLVPHPERLAAVYHILHGTLRITFDRLAKNQAGHTISPGPADDSQLPYETRIDNLKCSEATKRKARDKLKEIKLSKDGNDKPTKYLDGLLQVPFGTYRKEKILSFMDEYRAQVANILKGLSEHIDDKDESKDNGEDEVSLLRRIHRDMQGLWNTEEAINTHLASLESLRDDLELSDQLSEYSSIVLGQLQSLWTQWDLFKTDRKTYITKTKETLNLCIYGQEDAKRSITSLIAQWINGEMTGTIFGFQGYPGTGKTTLAKQGISRCLMNEHGEARPFYFIPLGGSSGGNTLEGHSYTYVGSHWGTLVECLRDAKVMNPILYFDELDKVSDTPKGDEIIRILTHLTDPEQNDKITDRYFDVDFDFSKALIIFSYNSAEKIDKILMDRIYEVKFRQYNCQEKVTIARQYILPKILKSVGYGPNDLVFNDLILAYIVDNYTVEAGVRDMKDKLTELVREINLRRIYAETDTTYTIPYLLTSEVVDDILRHRHKMTITEIPKRAQIGWVNGLYATTLGTGGITIIQAFDTPSDQKYALEITGNLGGVMKESVQCAKTISWSLFGAEERKTLSKWWCENALHIHFPAGGTSKDGPSAGAAITTAIVSYFSKLPVRNYIGMTGEIDLYGSVTAIGGLQCKLEGAQRAGVKLVLIPRGNEDEYREIQKDYAVKVHAVDNMSQIVRTCLVGAEAYDFKYPYSITEDETIKAILETIQKIET